MAFITSRNGICSSFHLKSNIPLSFRTLWHSQKPLYKSFCQDIKSSVPYFLVSQEVLPARIKCGGSKITRSKVASVKGMSRKSATISGLILISRSRFLSLHVNISFRISMYVVWGSFRSYQNIREPQHASSIFICSNHSVLVLLDKYQRLFR